MKTIEFLIKKTQFKAVPKTYSLNVNNTTFFSVENLIDSSVEFSYDVTYCDSYPTSTKAALVCLLDENSLVPLNYVRTIVSMYNLHHNMFCMCGPVLNNTSLVLTDIPARAQAMYKSYEIKTYNKFISMSLIGDRDNFPREPMGSIFSGAYYNIERGYHRTLTPRGYVDFDPTIYHNKIGEFIYTDTLKTYYHVVGEESLPENYSTYFYNMGFKAYKNGLAEQKLTIPGLKPDDHIEYSTLYQLGYIEAKLGRKIV